MTFTGPEDRRRRDQKENVARINRQSELWKRQQAEAKQVDASTVIAIAPGCADILTLAPRIDPQANKRDYMAGDVPPEAGARSDDVPPHAGKRESAGATSHDTSRSIQTLVEFLSDFVPPHYFVDGILQHHCMYTLTGKPGAGKTNLAVLVSVLVGHPIAGQKFGPHEVSPGRVLYIPAENKTDVQMRFIGLCRSMGVDAADLNILVTGDAMRLAQDFDGEFARIRREIAGFGDLTLVVVDTSPALFPGDDENNNVQMLGHAQRLRRFTDLPGLPGCLPLCHPIKGASSPDMLLPRGGGACLGEGDGNLTLWGYGDRLADLHWSGKFRGPDFAKITFRHEIFHTMDLVDHKGRPIPTTIAKAVTEAESEAAETKSMSQEDEMLLAMEGRPDGSLAKWAADCQWFLKGDVRSPNKRFAQHVMERLVGDKLVTKSGRDLVLTKAGKAAAAKAAKSRKNANVAVPEDAGTIAPPMYDEN